jgi:hypothetical protein
MHLADRYPLSVTMSSTSLPIHKVLYNDCHGEFAFSEAFLEAFTARTGRTLHMENELLRVGAHSIRCNADAIALFEEKGSEWSSGPGACLAIREFPAVFANYWEIDDYDGNETVRILVAEALADILITYMQTRDADALERQYAAVTEAQRAL